MLLSTYAENAKIVAGAGLGLLYMHGRCGHPSLVGFEELVDNFPALRWKLDHYRRTQPKWWGPMLDALERPAEFRVPTLQLQKLRFERARARNVSGALAYWDGPSPESAALLEEGLTRAAATAHAVRGRNACKVSKRAERNLLEAEILEALKTARFKAELAELEAEAAEREAAISEMFEAEATRAEPHGDAELQSVLPTDYPTSTCACPVSEENRSEDRAPSARDTNEGPPSAENLAAPSAQAPVDVDDEVERWRRILVSPAACVDYVRELDSARLRQDLEAAADDEHVGAPAPSAGPSTRGSRPSLRLVKGGPSDEVSTGVIGGVSTRISILRSEEGKRASPAETHEHDRDRGLVTPLVSREWGRDDDPGPPPRGPPS
jgi:hypothetical protein